MDRRFGAGLCALRGAENVGTGNDILNLETPVIAVEADAVRGHLFMTAQKFEFHGVVRNKIRQDASNSESRLHGEGEIGMGIAASLHNNRCRRFEDVASAEVDRSETVAPDKSRSGVAHVFNAAVTAGGFDVILARTQVP